MPGFVSLHSKAEVEAFCRTNPALHIYALGDLDEFFWPHTTWYALRDGSGIRQIALLYTGHSLPTVLAYAAEPVESMCELMAALLPVLPRRFYAHLPPGVHEVLADDYDVQNHGAFYKMRLTDASGPMRVDTSAAVGLSPADTEGLLALYRAAYPANFFVPRTL